MKQQLELAGRGDVVLAPIGGYHVHLMAPSGDQVEGAGEGEICVGGEHIARGYVSGFERAQERFVSDAMCGRGVLYRTGDFGRYGPDGNLQIVGRRDLEVNVNGFRVSTEEIETAIERCSDVERAIVVAQTEDVVTRLHAFVRIANKQMVPREAEFRSMLKASLPPHGIPHRVTFVRGFPTLQNGKIDRASLTRAGRRCSAADVAVVAPRTATEQVVTAICAKVLGVSTVSITDDFFSLGGDSLDAVRVSLCCEEQGLLVSSDELQSGASLETICRLMDVGPQDANDVEPL